MSTSFSLACFSLVHSLMWNLEPLHHPDTRIIQTHTLCIHVHYIYIHTCRETPRVHRLTNAHYTQNIIYISNIQRESEREGGGRNLILTPMDQPARGIMPTTQNVTEPMTKVASRPLRMLHVARTRTGNDRDTPRTRPNMALSAKA